MFRIPAARTAMVVVILASIAGAVLRVVTAADRVRDRRDTARTACAGNGGQWVQAGAVEMCRLPTGRATRL